jgi:peptidyl-prolyl cis-trans isomerase C
MNTDTILFKHVKLARPVSFTALFAAIIMLTSCGNGDISKSSQVLARVGDKEITTIYFERQLADLPESVRKLSMQGENKKAILDGLVNRELLYQEAIRLKVDKDADLARKLEDLRKEAVIKTFLQNRVMDRIKVDDAEVERYYGDNPGEYRNREEVRISQIVLPDEAKASDMLEKLSIRRDFGDLAQSFSIDKPSAERKGDVGWFTRMKLPAEIRDKVFNLGVGGTAGPFKMQDGWEIYRVTERRSTAYPLEKVKEIIRVQLFDEKLKKEIKSIVDGLKKNTTVQINEALLK